MSSSSQGTETAPIATNAPPREACDALEANGSDNRNVVGRHSTTNSDSAASGDNTSELNAEQANEKPAREMSQHVSADPVACLANDDHPFYNNSETCHIHDSDSDELD